MFDLLQQRPVQLLRGKPVVPGGGGMPQRIKVISVPVSVLQRWSRPRPT
ncbi:hypothetical protein JQ581_34700 [Bradyrhizobium liaoningense]|nr:hypothetical protein [Bradyrhizobium liaoningense]MBR0742099.1 hypothetical protein [Bradyrhizobium liaoningense]